MAPLALPTGRTVLLSLRLPAALLAALVLLQTATADDSRAAPVLDVAFNDKDASFQVFIRNAHWLGSAPIRAFAGGARLNLTRTGATTSTGTDITGAFSCTNVSWVAAGSGLVLHTSLKKYSASDLVIFVQQLPNGAAGTNASNPVLPGGLRVMDPGNYPPVVSFPSVAGGQLDTLGFVTWQSRMINVETGTNVTQGPPGTNEPLVRGRGLQG